MADKQSIQTGKRLNQTESNQICLRHLKKLGVIPVDWTPYCLQLLMYYLLEIHGTAGSDLTDLAVELNQPHRWHPGDAMSLLINSEEIETVEDLIEADWELAEELKKDQTPEDAGETLIARLRSALYVKLNAGPWALNAD